MPRLFSKLKYVSGSFFTALFVLGAIATAAYAGNIFFRLHQLRDSPPRKPSEVVAAEAQRMRDLQAENAKKKGQSEAEEANLNRVIAALDALVAKLEKKE